jgi:hypothetical protein
VIISDDSASEMSVGEDEIVSAGRRASRRILDSEDSEMSAVEAEDGDEDSEMAEGEDESDEERDEVSLYCVDFVYKSRQFGISITYFYLGRKRGHNRPKT